MSSAFAEVLRALSAAFGDLGLRYYLFGAQAALLYGAERLTADVDVTVEMEPAQAQRLVRALAARGFRTRIDDPEWIERTRVLPVYHDATGIGVDLVFAGSGIERIFLERSLDRSVAGVVFRVACPEDLVAMKLLAGRAKDLQDVEAIAESLPDLDRARVHETLAALENALDRSDLRPLFERILDAVRER